MPHHSLPRRHFATVLCLTCVSLSSATLAADKPNQKPKPTTANFTGSWIFEFETGGFGLDLVQTGDAITGYHSSVVNNGNRVDTAAAELDMPPSIKGTVKDGIATVTFKSSYGDGTGVATLKLTKDGQLDWKITSSTGSHYFPEESLLKRQKTKKTK